MRKHIYLHTSNLENAQEFSDDLCFEPAYMYCHQIKNISPYEWGRIKTEAYYYHIMIGNIRNDNCPWCGSTPNLVELSEKAPFPMPDRVTFFYECLNCGSRGPVNKIHFNEIMDICLERQVKDEVKAKIKARYSERKQWDHDLVNPYEKKESAFPEEFKKI